MTILRANLKHFYQCRGVWLWYVILLGQTQIMRMAYESGRFFGYLILSILAATLVTNLQQDVMAKPFSFCMPGHRKVPRKVIMLVGGILNAAFGMVFLAHPSLAFPYSLLVAIAGGFVGMSVYLLTARSTLKGLNQWSGSSVIKILLMILLLGAGIYYKFLQEMTVAYPLIIIAISYGICWLTWWQLGQDSLAREFCGKVVPGMMDGWNASKMQKIGREKMKKMGDNNTAINNWLENFFLSKMQRHKFLSRNRYIWGSLYADLWPFSVNLKPASLATIVALVVTLGYYNTSSFSMNYMILIIPAITAASLKLPACPNLLLPGGRREMFGGVLVSAFFATIIIGVALIILMVISHLVEPFLPPIHIKTFTFSYQALDIGKFYLFMTIMPIVLVTTVIVRRRFILKFIVPMFLMQIAILSKAFSKHLDIIFTPVTIALVIVVFWLIFVMLAYNFCMKKCLVSQTKG